MLLMLGKIGCMMWPGKEGDGRAAMYGNVWQG